MCLYPRIIENPKYAKSNENSKRIRDYRLRWIQILLVYLSLISKSINVDFQTMTNDFAANQCVKITTSLLGIIVKIIIIL